MSGDGALCPRCESTYTVEVRPPSRGAWFSDVLCADCGLVFEAEVQP